MHKLKRKVFLTLFLFLTLVVALLTFIMGYRDYTSERDTLQAQMVSVNSAVDRFPSAETYPDFYSDFYGRSFDDDDDDDDYSLDRDENQSRGPHVVMVSEFPIYSIVMNRSGDFVKVGYFNTDGSQVAEAISEAGIIMESAVPGQMFIGNLFTDHYVWYYGGPNILTIIDVSSLSRQLWQMVWLSLFAFVVELLVIVYICRSLTRWMIRPIEEAFEKQKQFIADASHELKTPLAVIMASAEAMERDGNPKWLGNIESEADRMNALIKSLLDLTKSEQETLTLSKVNLSFLAMKEISIQEAVSFEKGIELKEEIPDDICVLGQSEMLEKVLEILLDNALCHARDEIIVSLETRGNQAVLRVENNGDTIPEGEREKIFERFYRSDASRNRQENRYGLGLAIARNLITRMGGEIGVEERNGLTSFYIRLRLDNS